MYKVGDKFIIEIGGEYAENPFENGENGKAPTMLYRIKGFDSLVFDEKGLNRLTSYNEEFDSSEETIADAEKYGYEKGLSDAWELVKKICLSPADGGAEFNTIKEIFGEVNLSKTLLKYTPQEAIEKLKTWEEKQEIKVGDVIKSTIGSVAVVQYIDSWDMWECFGKGGYFTLDHEKQRYWKKTGKHIDLSEIFKGLEAI